MGAWGTALFSDDTASDVRDDYVTHIGDGLDDAAATARLLEAWSSTLADVEDSAVFWLALAATKWRLGRLDEATKSRALEVIRRGDDVRRWDHDAGLKRKREAVLAKLQVQLESPQPEPRKVPRRFRNACDWPVGEVVAYTRDGKRPLVFRVIGHHSDAGGTAPVVEFLDWKGADVPEAPATAKLRVLTDRSRHTAFMLAAASAREIPAARLVRLGIGGPPSRPTPDGGYLVLLWRMLDGFLES
jgi:hypothetical protein